jgi:hypothetical protein
MDPISIIVNITSIILAIVSISLSLYFFGVSYKANQDTTKMSGDIKNSTSNLEKLFDRLYSDTFNMLKNQNDAMQKHIFKTVGDTGDSLPKQDIELSVISLIIQHRKLTLDTLCKQIKNSNREKIEEIVKQQKAKGSIDFDGDLIIFKNIKTSTEENS